MEFWPIIKAVTIIGIILVIVFLSQQQNFSFVGKNLAENSIVRQIWTPINNWLTDQVSGGVQQNIDSVGQKITEEKNTFFQNVWENIKNYLAEKFSNISGTKVK